MKAKKSLGQHFLIQESIAERIARSILAQDQTEHILEVGAGHGMLTKYLLERPEQLSVVEIDRDVIPGLKARFKNLPVHEGDFLKLNLTTFMPKRFHLVGNFPYNISSQILFKMLDYRQQIPQLVGMFQREVAQRIASDHGSKKYGILSVLMQAFYDVEYLFTVKPGSFSPAPKVDSAVIRLVEKKAPLVQFDQEKSFRTVVKLAFGQRRKMLRNSLKPLLTPLTIGRFGHLRPEQLSVHDFANLNAILISSTDKKDKDGVGG